MGRNLTLYGIALPTSSPEGRRRAQIDMARWVTAPGRILSVAGRFPLYEAAAAHEAVEQGGKVGTVVIECAQ
jgi:NADPH2:quinone reductase